jgi:hypothetical protein
LANVFIETARHSPHSFESPEEELEELIFNYAPYFTLKDSIFDGSYDGRFVSKFSLKWNNIFDEKNNI